MPVVAGCQSSASRTGPGLVAGVVALAAVLAVTLGGCTAGTTSSAHGPAGASAPGSAAASGTSSAATPASAPPIAAVSEALPSYYAEATAARRPAYNSPANLTVRVTSTGAALATVRPPAPYQSFGYVYATSSPDVWVAGAQRWHPGGQDNPAGQDNKAQLVALFKVTFSPATRKVTLMRLPAPTLPGSDLEAVALSPDGSRLALVTLIPPGQSAGHPGAVWLRVYPLAGRATAVAARDLATFPLSLAFDDYSLTWLDNDRTLAVGGPFGTVQAGRPYPAGVVYADGTAPGLPVIRTVHLAFPTGGNEEIGNPKAPPQNCFSAPLATSDGRSVICGGAAATTLNMGPAINVGVWVFSAATGRLTTTWDRHVTCCAISVYPSVLWASPDGGTVVADGLTQANEGEVLYVRPADGHLRQIPWPGVSYYPDAPGNDYEPPVAW